MAKLRLLIFALCAAPGFVGCASVLGIETATHDPKLDNAGAANGGGGNAGNAGAGGDVDSGGDQSLCGRYCNTVQANCTDANQQYVSKLVCMRICARLDPGQPGDEVGNTVNCRLHFAESAVMAGEPASNCSVAGPGGANAEKPVCGTYCEGLCRIALDTCKAGDRIFASVSECVAACANVPDIGNYADSIQSGDSVQCRLYHVSAAQIDPGLHCPHVSGLVGPCKPP